jgi:hypothetical protein
MKALAIAMTTIALAVAPAMFAQQPDAPKAGAPAQAQAEQSLTGCLAGAENSFTLKTSSGEVQLQGNGLAAHVGKTIRVTGTQSTVAGKSTFKVTDVEVVSPRCQA